MIRQSPVGDILLPSDRVKDVAIVCSVRLWYHGHDGYLWFHPSAVINIPTGSGNISTTIQTPEGEVVPITVSWSSLLVEVENFWLNSGFHTIHCAFLNGFAIPIEYFTAPLISVVGNEILDGCFVTIIQLIVTLFSSGVAISFFLLLYC